MAAEKYQILKKVEKESSMVVVWIFPEQVMPKTSASAATLYA